MPTRLYNRIGKMRIRIVDSGVCQRCSVHSCSFLNTAKTKTDFYKLSSETSICPRQAISEEGPSDSELRTGHITNDRCVFCGLCVKFCAHHNLKVEEFDCGTSEFHDMTEPQVNAVASVYLSTLFDFSANSNRNRSLLFDGYVSTGEEEAYVEVDLNDDSLESLRRLLGDMITYSMSHEIHNGLMILSNIPAKGSRDVYAVIKKMREFPTTQGINIYITTFSLLKAMSLHLPKGQYTLRDLFFNYTEESLQTYSTRIKSLLKICE